MNWYWLCMWQINENLEPWFLNPQNQYFFSLLFLVGVNKNPLNFICSVHPYDIKQNLRFQILFYYKFKRFGICFNISRLLAALSNCTDFLNFKLYFIILPKTDSISNYIHFKTGIACKLSICIDNHDLQHLLKCAFAKNEHTALSTVFHNAMHVIHSEWFLNDHSFLGTSCVGYFKCYPSSVSWLKME